jgi:Sigma-70 region 2
MLGTTTATKAEALEKKDFDKLFRDHQAMVFRVAYSVVKCRQDAEDVLQTVFAQFAGREMPDPTREQSETLSPSDGHQLRAEHATLGPTPERGQRRRRISLLGPLGLTLQR